MPNEFITKNGLISQGNITGTGSLVVSQNITASNISVSATGSFGIVGIGTTSPSAKLTIVDNTNGGTINLVGRTSDDTAAINFRATGDASTYAYISPDTNEFRLYHNDGFMSFYPGGTEKARITSGGNVGIGTTSVNFKLDIWGATGTTLNMANVDDSGRGGKLTFISSSAAGRQFFVGTNSSIYNLVFGIDSIEKMRLDTSGNVGIGTTSPSYKLDVSGSIRAAEGEIIATGNNAAFRIYRTSGINYFDWASGQNLYLGTVTSEGGAGRSNKMVVFNDGTVGIGTTVATAKLNIASTSQTTKAIIQSVSAATGLGGYLAFNPGGDSTYSKVAIGVYDNYFSSFNRGNIAFMINSAADATEVGFTDTKMYISASGNVGIGSTSPSSKFEVLTSAVSLANQPNIIGNFRGDTDGRSLIRVDNTSTSAGAAALQSGISFVAYSNVSSQPSANKHEAQIILGSTGATSVPGGQTGTLQIIAPQDIAFNVSASNIIMTGSSYTTFGYNAMYINRAGNIGIGTTNPSSRLHISGSSATAITITDDVLYTNSISNDNSVMTYTVDTGNAAAASAAHVFKRFNTELVRIDPSGDVGIGTSVPGALLDVSYGDYQNAGTIRMGADLGINTSRTNATRKWGLITGYNYTNASAAIPIIGYDSANTYTAINIGGGTSAIAASPTYISFYTTSSLSTYGTERVRIDSSGLVGIGTTNPSYLIDVYKTSNDAVIRSRTTGAGAYVYLDSATDGWYGINMLSGSTSRWFVGSYGTSDFTITRGLGSSEYVRVTTTGNVGIGTTAPAYKLDVSGSSRFGFTTTSTHQFTGSVSFTDGLSLTNLTASNISASGTSSFGYVGIGTTNPTYKLDLQPTSSVARFGQATVGAFPANSSVFAFFGHTNLDNINTAANYALLQSSNGDTFLNASSGRNVYFRIANSDKMILDSNGKVGIGTTSPLTGFLDVRTNQTKSVAGPTNIAFFGSGDSGNPLGLVLNHESSSGIKMIGLVGTEYGASGNNIKINETLTVQYNGYVGIGTTVPTAQLHVCLDTSTYSSKNVVRIVNLGYSGITGAQNWTIRGAYQYAGGIANNADGGDLDIIKSLDRNTILATKTDGTTLGNVGIGTTSPAYLLDVSGSSRHGYRTSDTHFFTGSVSISGSLNATASWANNVVSASFATTAQTANALNTSNNYQVNSIGVNIAGSGTAGKIGTNELGVRSWSITPTGGRLLFESGDGNGSAYFVFPVTASTFVGAGTGLTGTAASLTAGTANALNAANSYTVASLTSGYVDVTGTTIPTTGIYRPSTKTLGLSADGTLIFKISNVSAPATSSIETGNFLVSGSVGIGTTNPTDKLTVYGALASYKTGADTIQTQVYLANGGNTRAFNLQLNSGGTGLDLWSYNSSNAWLKHTTFDYDGRVGIGTAAPVAKFEISGSSNSALMNIKSPISGAILYVSGSGAVGIGTSNVGAYTLQVNGSFGATTKSFVIDHPTKEGKKLIYGSLESPYHGIRLTGRDTLKEGKCKIELPDYIYKLILHDSVNIQLTGIKCNKTLYVDDINIPENYFTIAYDKAIFESYKDYDFFWDFTAIRADVPELITEL